MVFQGDVALAAAGWTQDKTTSGLLWLALLQLSGGVRVLCVRACILLVLCGLYPAVKGSYVAAGWYTNRW